VLEEPQSTCTPLRRILLSVRTVVLKPVCCADTVGQAVECCACWTLGPIVT